MALKDRTYSRIVMALKIALPLSALALLSTIFLFSSDSDPSANIPFSQRMQDRAEQQAITEPFFSGTTENGSSLTISAVSARPDGPDFEAARVDGLRAEISIVDGGTLDIEADTSDFDIAGGRAVFTGNVQLSSSTGYQVTTEGLNTSLSHIDAFSIAPVSGVGPAGQFTAGRLEISSSGQDNVHLLFTNGVKLVYDPRK